MKSSHKQLGERVLGTITITIALGGAPGAELRMEPAGIRAHDPGKLIVRLEGHLAGLESLKREAAPQRQDADWAARTLQNRSRPVIRTEAAATATASPGSPP